MKNIVWLLFVSWLLAGSIALAASNPFVAGKPSQEPPARQELRYPRVLRPLLAQIAAWQRVIHARLTALGREIRNNPYGQAFWLFLLFALIYGVIHALGPGHGKIIVVSYFLSHPSQYLHGIIMGQVLTFVHVFSAAAIILSIRFALQTSGLAAFEAASRHVESVSYGLLILLGLVLLGRTLYDWRQGRQPGSAEAQASSFKQGVLTAIVTGLIPCPGAALILLFTLTQQIVLAGMLAMVCVAIGMGLTTAGFACLAITSRAAVLRLATRHQTLFTACYRLLAIAGAVLILMVGMVCLIGAAV